MECIIFTGRISTTHNGSGLYDSWSWISSNFHIDDVMDSSYTDPSYVPIYGLDGVSNDLLEVRVFLSSIRILMRSKLKLAFLFCEKHA
jgi:hypothetical protein